MFKVLIVETQQAAADAFVLNIDLPDMSGLDLLRWIRAAGNRVDVVLPKGISAGSLEAVSTALRKGGGGVRMSAVEVASISGMSRVTARRYLEYLVESGRAERTARYRGAGRPEFEYRLVPAADWVALRPDDPLRLLSPVPTSQAEAAG
jgi:response regulator of citrate/malate metabolism